ncbi:BEACH domain-containing protein B [Vitis vinifera]|uniref:BEACH domain-containing protein B n=1 Tax=Vitis vinifera TaxID=29760 RepID=A0A438G055_VITVI|nr:BEACH domain-containing protein B [Vitis vinifera]
MKEQWTDTPLQYLTLRTLYSALSENPRGQNHFRSIGGLEVLLDGLGLPPNNPLISKISCCSDEERIKVGSEKRCFILQLEPILSHEMILPVQVATSRDENPSLDVFWLHILSLEVLREAVYPLYDQLLFRFGNLNNLQFLCENGRVHKFANSFCLLAFMVQEYKQQSKDDFQLPAFDSINENKVEICIRKSFLPLPDNASYLQYWSDYAVKLNRVLCSFLLAAEENRSHHVLLSTGRSAMPVSSVYGELSIKWIMRVLLTIFPCIKAFTNQNEVPIHLRIFVNTLQNSVLHAFRTILVSSPLLLEVFREEGIWDLIFSENFFYFGPASEGSSIECCTYNEGSLSNSEIYASNYTDCQGKAVGVEILQMEVISFVEFAATFSGSAHNLVVFNMGDKVSNKAKKGIQDYPHHPECSVLLDALEQSSCNPEIASILAKSLLRILQLSCEKTIASFKTLDAITRVLKVACIQAQEYGRPGNIGLNVKNKSVEVVSPQSCQRFDPSEKAQSCLKSMEASMDLLMEYISIADSDDAEILVLRSSTCVDCLFDLFWEKTFRNRVLNLILDLMKIVPFSDEDQRAKLRLCSKYLETFTQIKEREKSFAELSIDLLVGMRAMLLTDQVHYQDLFRDGECFLHVVSLLNGNLDEANGEKLVLNVLQTLTCLLARNDASKAAFRALVGKGYQTLQSLLLEFCQWRPSEGLLNALLDMLVDGKFDIKASPVIKNEDVIILYLSILQKSSDSSRHYGLNVFQQLLRDSISNRASCVRAGMLNFLLDWFSQEDMDSVILKIAQLIQVTGGHSISGKDIRKIFALLRSKKIGTQQKYCSLLLTSILSMLNEKGPTAFFDLNGSDSVSPYGVPESNF